MPGDTDVIKDLLVRFRVDMTQLDAGMQKLNAAIDNQQKTIQSKYGALSSTLRNAGTAMTVGLTAPLLMAGRSIAGTVMEMDSLEQGLTAVMGSSAKAKQELKALVDVAKLPGLGIKEAVQGSIGLQAAGLSAEQARKSLKAFGNALATVGKGKVELAGVNQQLIQMAGNDKVLTEDTRILKNYVPQLSQAMKNAFGTANSEQIQKMGVSTQEFIRRTSEELAKLKPVTGGLRVNWENAMDSMTMAMWKFKNAIAPVVQAISNTIQKLSVQIQGMSESTRKALFGLGMGAAAAGPLMLLLSKLPGMIAGVSLAVKGLRIAWVALSKGFTVSNPIGWVILGITTLIALFAKFHNQMGLTDAKLKAIGDSIKKYLLSVWNQLKPSVIQLMDSTKKLRDAMKPLIDIVLKLVGKACMAYLAYQFMQIKTAISVLLPIVKVLVAYFTNYYNILAKVIEKLSEWFHLQNKNASNAAKGTLVDILQKTAIAGIQKAAALQASLKKSEQDRYNAALTKSKERVQAIKDEIAAEREKRLAQVGFTSLQGMWQKQMEAGTSERFSTIITGANKSSELNEAQKQTKYLESMVDKLEKLINEYRKVSNSGAATLG